VKISANSRSYNANVIS